MTSFNYNKWDNIELSDDEVAFVIKRCLLFLQQ